MKRHDETMLYKLASDGKLQVWAYSLENTGTHALIHVHYGDLGGAIQVKTTTITKGKNLGKANATTALQQAASEAQSKYEKKLKEGYVTTIEAAKAGQTDEIIEGGLLPMLAHTYEDNKHKIKFPVYVQPKLDGHRCIALKKDGKVELWSRKRHRITSMPHIEQEVSTLLSNSPDGAFLDGELYVHGGLNFENISSLCRKTVPVPACYMIQYHVYDCGILGTDQNYKRRSSFLTELQSYYHTEHVYFVPSIRLETSDDLDKMHAHYTANGYEGLMLRALDTPYEYGKRSYNLMKMKYMQDCEFPILSVYAGKDNTVIFVVQLPTGKTTDVNMSGSRDDNQIYLKDKSTWEGKELTVQFFRYTAEGCLYLPVGLRIRQDI